MAAFAQTRLIHAYDPNSYTLQQLDYNARNNQATITVNGRTVSVAEAALRKLRGLPQFEIFGTTDTNTAAASSPVISLSDEGVIFPANTRRVIRVHTIGFNGANRWEFVTEQRVMGATDPTLQGPEQYITDCMATLGCTSADGTTMTEVAAECIAPAWWDGASPVAADVSSNVTVISWLGANAPSRVLIPGAVQAHDAAGTAADGRAFQHGLVSAANSTSSVFIDDLATPTAANFPNASAIRVTALVYPPLHTPVLIDTVSTPDEVFIGALGLSSDVVTWQIRVFVGDLVTVGPLV